MQRKTHKCSERHRIAAKDMNDTVNNEELANDSNEWTNDNIGWRRPADGSKRMKASG
jgi:hypothetical protein